MLKIDNLKRADINAAVELWNTAANMRMPYTALSKAEFASKFFENAHFDDKLLFAARENDCLVGFALAYIKKEYLLGENFGNTPVYLTMLLVDEPYLNKGIAAMLLNAITAQSQKIGKDIIRITYRNPIALSWEIPGAKGHTHNNAPGVAINSAAYSFFKKHGFAETQRELGMHLNLNSFSLSEKYYAKNALLFENDIEVTLYNKNAHHGFEQLFTALNGEVWRKTIRDNNALEHPLPIIIAHHNGTIIGFAGPIDKEAGGRGWFNGIATHPAYERRGIAYVMFCRLMAEFKRIGADFSTLFTNSDNPAAGLYQNVGFDTALEFAIMEKCCKAVEDI